MGTSLVNGLGGAAGFGESFLARNDDGSTPFIDLRTLFGSQGINFFGRQYTGFYLNNNGSLTFATATGSYTPTSITGSTSNPIIAAYWADVDTRISGIGSTDTRSGVVSPTPGGTSTGSDLLWYDIDPTTRTFTATWDDVGYFNSHTDKLNAFQISITQIGTNGDFDITYRYEAVNWTAGDASSGVGGLGGVPARAGYSSGNGVDYLELPQSGNQSALLDLENASNIGVPGTYVFSVRGGSTAPAISVGDASVVEGNGPANRFIVVPVFLAAASSSPITVQYTTADGSAHGGQDYVAQSGILTFAAGVTQQSLFIEVIGDTAIEGNETLSIVLSNPSGAPITDGSATATIIDDDGLVVSDVSALEGTGTTPTAFTFTVSLLTAAAGTVSVNYATENGTATAGPDYVATSGTLTFLAGETSKTVTVNVAPDQLSEADEAFNVRLSGAVGAGISDAVGVGTILNDDGLVVSDVVIVEGTSATPTTAHVSIRLLTASTTSVSVHWATSPGSATSPADFAASSGTVTFEAGETVKTVAIPIIADSLIEGEESFNIVLSSPTGSAIVDGTGLVRIADDDGFSVSSAAVTEGTAGTTTSLVFTVTLGSALATQSTVNYATANGTATAGSDYLAANGTLTFLAGETSKTVTVEVNGDLSPEDNETLTLNLSGASAGSGIRQGTGSGTIFNDDGLSINDTAITEGDSGTVQVTVTVTLSAPAPGNVTVAYATEDGTATAGVDYVATSGTLVFAAGETSKTILVAVKGDTQFEGNETFRVVLSSPTGSGLVDGSATVTIQNDDARPPPSFRIVDAALVEGTGAGSSILRFQVALSELVTFDASVNYATSGGTAGVGTDYTATTGTLTITAGSLYGFISVPIVRDAIVEADETFTVTLSSPSTGTAIATGTATGTILNDDVTLAIAATANSSRLEGSAGSTPFTFTVTRSGDSSIAHSVDWTVSGAAVTGADFTGGVLPSGSLTFAAGETAKTITVNVAGDLAVEANEAFAITLSNPSLGATITTAAAAGTIRNDDSLLSIAAASADKAEGAAGATTPFTFRVTRTGNTAGVQSAHWAVSGAAVSGADFIGGALPSGTVTFAAGETSKTITVDVAGDSSVEANEAFSVVLSTPTGGATIGTGSAIGTIRNDDTAAAVLSIAAVNASKAEGQSGNTPFTFTVTRTGDTSVAHSASWAVGGAAVAGADFAGGALPSGTVSFAAGQTSSTITVNVAGDTTVEANEAFTVTLSGPSTGATLGTAAASSTILNDDATLSIAAVNASKAEGQSGNTPFTFTVTRTGDTSVAHSAHWAVGGAAVAGADFAGGALPAGTVSFAAGQTSSTITVNVAGDTTVEANEAFTVTLSGPSTGATLGTAAATSTILNDDSAAAALAITATAAQKAEGHSGTTAFTFTVTRTGSTVGASSANWAVSGAAVNGADFIGGALPAGTVTFAAGETSKTITVGIAGDSAVETNESFTVGLSGPSAGTTITTASATGTILNDDSAFSIKAVAAVNAEGGAGTTKPFTFSITRTGDTTVARSVAWTVGGAAVTSADFAGGVLPSGTAAFAAGETVKTISVVVAGDNLVEGDEGFTVTLSPPGAGASLVAASANGTIRNDDASSGNNPLTGTANTDFIDGLAGNDKIYGLAGNDVLIGGDGNDLLDGGAGADLMVGGLGNDRYYVDQVGDVVLEIDARHGIDTVFSSISYTLGENVEQVVLTGTAAINATGNADDNFLSGNDAANALFGGAGDDTLDGGGGNDKLNGSTGIDTASYASAGAGVAVDLATTVAQNTVGAGMDTLAAIENLEGSGFNDSLKGNAAANVLSGGAGNDTIDGRVGDDIIDGGEGIDSLTGGAGADTFVFSSPLVAGQFDTIVGFDAQADTVELSNVVFRAFQSSFGVEDSAFEIGSAATSSLTRLLYDSASGALLYDRDGTGGAAAVKFAAITGLSGELSAGNFTIG